MPTWWEFVQDLLESEGEAEGWDPHWRPVYLACTPCTFTYNTILKFEHLEKEMVVSQTKIPVLEV